MAEGNEADGKFKERAGELPEKPGVYFLKDHTGCVIYIGKAKNLKKRVSSYTHAPASDDPRLLQLAAKVADVDFLETPTEIDALITEARLIKDTQPKYNVQLKDDKSFPMIKITNDDDFPKVLITRERDDRSAEYIGPFVDAEGLRDALKALQRIFKFATCKLTIRADDEKRRFFRPCLLYSINRCTAPCADRISREEYADDIESLRNFLRGERKKLIRSLYRKMEEASKNLDFERAAEVRDQVKALDTLAKKSPSDDYIEGDLTPIDPQTGIRELMELLKAEGVAFERLRTIDGVDIANIGGEDAVGSLVTFVDGIPFKSGYRRYKITTVEGVDDYAMIREVVVRRFRRLRDEEDPFPDILLIDGGVGHLNTAAAALKGEGIAPPLLMSLAKEEELPYLYGREGPLEMGRFPHARSLLMYIRDEAHRFAQHYHHFLRRRSMFRTEE